MYNRTNIQNGFTLIELLVVIAIIGILSSVVLSSLTTARQKANDSATTANLNGTRAKAQLYSDANGLSYAGVCTDPDGIAESVAAANATCTDDSDGWTATALLETGSYFCVDSTGDTASTSAGVTNGITWEEGVDDCVSL